VKFSPFAHRTVGKWGYYLLGCDAIWSGLRLPTFPMTLLRQGNTGKGDFIDSQDGGSGLLQNGGVFLPIDMAWYPKTLESFDS
jgi:hypothetical protein